MTYILDVDSEVNVIDSAAAVPADATESAVYAIPQRSRLLCMTVKPVGTFTALSVSLKISNQQDSGFATIKTMTDIGGGLYTSPPLAARFCKVVVNSSTGAERTGLVVGLYSK